MLEAKLKFMEEKVQKLEAENVLLKAKTDKSSRAENFSCYFCPDNFSSKMSVTTHMQEHVEVQEIKCDLCHSSFSTKSNLDDHMKTVTRTKGLCLLSS